MAAFALGLVSAVAAAAERPNIVFLLSDDQHRDTIHALGNAEIETPHLDELARRGTSFSNVFCMGSTQPAVCMPSRAMLLSGRSLFRAPVDLKGVTILPEVLRSHGYVTFGTGKWHNGQASFRGFDRGRAIFFGGMGNQRKVPVSDLESPGTFAKRPIVDKFSSELFIDEAIAFIEQQHGEQPFFAYVAFTAPHDPRMAPDEYLAKYDPAKLSLPKAFLPEHPFDNGELKIRDEALAPWPRTPEIVRRHTADYYAAITHLDAQIGRLVAALERTGRREKTIIIFTSDHGLALGRHGLFGKQNLYEHSMRPPLIVAGPGIPAGKKCEAMAYLYDLFATVCDLAEAKPPAGVESWSLVPLLRGEKTEHREAIYCAYRDVQRSLREREWKVIEYPKIERTQLFHLADDPDELHDLAAEPQHAERLAGLRKRLAEERTRAGR
jgi:arylsulfatase A-like enzyme